MWRKSAFPFEEKKPEEVKINFSSTAPRKFHKRKKKETLGGPCIA
jgi:hypothetical protein